MPSSSSRSPGIPSGCTAPAATDPVDITGRTPSGLRKHHYPSTIAPADRRAECQEPIVPSPLPQRTSHPKSVKKIRFSRATSSAALTDLTEQFRDGVDLFPNGGQGGGAGGGIRAVGGRIGIVHAGILRADTALALLVVGDGGLHLVHDRGDGIGLFAAGGLGGDAVAEV